PPPFAIAGSPPAALIVDPRGSADPNGQIFTNPAALGLTSVTFSVAAVAVVGTPHPAVAAEIGKLRCAPAVRIGPPVAPAGLRVSTMRHGVTEKKLNGPA